MSKFLVIIFSFLMVFQLSAQGISGKITNLKGEPLPYATVQVFNSQLGTIANINGDYLLQLPEGNHIILFAYLGYKTLKFDVTIGSTQLEKNVVLEPQNYNLQEYTFKAGKEDAAYPIMRKAINYAKLHLISVENYQARSYIKGTFTLTKIPWLMEKAMKDSDIKEGTTYVLESVNDIKFSRPNTIEEKVLSSRSNLPPGSNPNIQFLKNSLYKPLSGDFVSPLSPNAFAHYQFKYMGTFNEGDDQVIKIKVIPKSKGPNIYAGFINLVEPSLAFHSIDLTFTDDQGIQFVMKQIYAPFNEVWMPVTQEIMLDMSIMGIKAKGNYVTSIRSYQVTPGKAFYQLPTKESVNKAFELKEVTKSVQPEAKPDLSTKKNAKKVAKAILKQEEDSLKKAGEDTEVVRNYSYKVDSLAFQIPDSIWNSLRQIPLTELEVKGYKEADSIYLANKERYLKDSIKTLPKFKILHVLNGHTYNYGTKDKNRGYLRVFNFEGLLSGFKELDIYNTVDGAIIKTGGSYNYKWSEHNSFQIGSTLRYAIARNTLNFNLYLKRNFKNSSVTLSGGSMVSQFNSNNPISNGVNLIYTLLANQNFMKLYERNYVSLFTNKRLNPKVSIAASLEYNYRKSLDNNSFAVWIPSNKRGFTNNNPENTTLENTDFQNHNAILSFAKVSWRPFAKTSIYNDVEYAVNSYKPSFSVSYNGGFWETSFNRISLSVEQNIKLGAGNYFEYNLTAGSFIGEKPNQFIDFFHLNANQTLFSGSLNQFRNLNYYRYSTNAYYIQGFAAFNFRKLALTRILALKMIGWNESLFINQAIVNQATYTELGYRLFGIGRAFGLDIYSGFLNGNYSETGFRLVVPF